MNYLQEINARFSVANSENRDENQAIGQATRQKKNIILSGYYRKSFW